MKYSIAKEEREFLRNYLVTLCKVAKMERPAKKLAERVMNKLQVVGPTVELKNAEHTFVTNICTDAIARGALTLANLQKISFLRKLIRWFKYKKLERSLTKSIARMKVVQERLRAKAAE